jgi:hypothetical protein
MIAHVCSSEDPLLDFAYSQYMFDDLNIISYTKDIDEVRNHLKMEFEMKDLGRTKLFLGLHLEHLRTGLLVHQLAYVQKVL